ncbi:MAG: hypothetical protein HY319_24600 [Armatimonadetes bacterium]|nr:hypothetical protein [Armatimonadota bacterium]
MRYRLLPLVLLLSILPAWGDGDTPSAMITHLSGGAVVVSNGQKAPAQPTMPLMPRTLLDLRGGTQMTVVFFSDGHHEEYAGPCLVGIGKKQGKVLHGPDSARTVTVENSALVKAIDPAALTETPSGTGLSFQKGAGGNPVFSWKANQPGPYIVTVYKPAEGSQPRAAVWSTEVAALSANYQGPTLDPDTTYVWNLKGAGIDLGSMQFRIHTDDTPELLTLAQSEATGMTQADPGDTTPHVLLSTVYQQHGMSSQAVDALMPAVNAQPNETAFMQRLKGTFQQMGEEASAKKWEEAERYAEDNSPPDSIWGLDGYYDTDSWPWDWDL